ncbi:MAG: hypothetical protein ACJ75B_11675 [Flavisolibacter sp.]
MRKVYAILLMLYWCITTHPQENKVRYENQVWVNLPRLIDPANPGIEMGYERALSRKFSQDVIIGWMRPVFQTNKFEGYRFGLEEKIFLNRHEPALYLAAQLIYNHSALYHVDNYGYDSTANAFVNAPFTIVQENLSLNFISGLVAHWRRVVLDLYMGIGIKYRTIRHINRKYPIQPRLGFDPYRSREGSSWQPNLPISIRIGFAF